MTQVTQEEKDMRRAARNNVRRLLWQWGNTINRIKRLERERTFFRDQADDMRRTLRSPSLTGMPRGGNTTDLSDTIVSVIRETERYEKQVEKIDAEIDDALRLRNCMEECIARLTPLQEKIISYRYSDGHGWQYIAMKMSYDEASVRRIDAQAVDAIAEMIEITAG